MAAWNDPLRPFAWTKTAEEIPHSLVEELAKISPAAHQKSREFRAQISDAGYWLLALLPGATGGVR